MVTYKPVKTEKDFNPRSPHGERQASPSASDKSADFNPRSPHGERLDGSQVLLRNHAISIHAPRTGSDALVRRQPLCRVLGISIHAPRTGSDTRFQHLNLVDVFISIHAPRTGSDLLLFFVSHPHD